MFSYVILDGKKKDFFFVPTSQSLIFNLKRMGINRYRLDLKRKRRDKIRLDYT